MKSGYKRPKLKYPEINQEYICDFCGGWFIEAGHSSDYAVEYILCENCLFDECHPTLLLKMKEMGFKGFDTDKESIKK